MLARFRRRSYEPERLDTGDYTADEYEACLNELRRVNRWLGDSHALKRTLLPELRRAEVKRFSLLDVGAGSGELLRVAAREASRIGVRAELVGVELNERSARAIMEESRGFDRVASVRADALRLPFAEDAFDYAVCSLFTHHFRDEGVISVLREMARVARRRAFVIDLHRHALAYLLYTTAGKLLLRSQLVREDGALSILRGFRPPELRQLAAEADLVEIDVRRCFPFRLVLSGRARAGKGGVEVD
jgi:SAM-dependent methyltransferase